MSRGRSLESIKQRISELKFSIEDAEEREANAKEQLVTAHERQMKHEAEARSLRNRLSTLSEELGRVSGRNSDILNQLDQNALRSEESESSRKRLEEKEEEGFERTRECEESAKTVKYDLEEKENLYKDATIRAKSLANDLKRVEERYDRAIGKEEELQRQYDDIMGTTGSLESNVNDLNDKEDDFKEKIAFLNDQIKQVTTLEEEKTAKIKTSERLNKRIEDEIRSEKEKIIQIEKQFEEIEGGV